MTIPRIFVSYHPSDETSQFVHRLIDDLQAAGADVITDSSNLNDNVDDVVNILRQELPTCQWAILVQTPSALRSPRVQMIVNTALNLVVQQSMHSVLRMIAMPSDLHEVPPTWTTLSEFDASQDYPRALAKLFLALSLTPTDKIGAIAPPPLPLPTVIGSPPSSIEGERLVSAPLPAVMKQSKATLSLHAVSDKPILVSPYRLFARSGQSKQRSWLITLTVVLTLILIVTIPILLVQSYYQRAASTVNTPTTLTVPANSNAISTAIANDNATATANTASLQQLYIQATSGRPIFDDLLNSQGNIYWQTATSNSWSCTFTGNAYHLSVFKTNFSHHCLASNTNFSNFAFQVEMTIIKGNAGGVVFRATDQYDHLYRFLLYQNGSYELYGIPTSVGNIPRLIQGVTLVNVGRSNLLTVIAYDGDIYLYINKIYVSYVKTSTGGNGSIGMESLATTQPTEVAFRNAEVWNI